MWILCRAPCSPTGPQGHVEVKPAFYGASDTPRYRLKGKSSHAAYPDRESDAIVVSAAVIAGVQTLVSRSISALDSAVITIGEKL